MATHLGQRQTLEGRAHHLLSEASGPSKFPSPSGSTSACARRHADTVAEPAYSKSSDDLPAGTPFHGEGVGKVILWTASRPRSLPCLLKAVRSDGTACQQGTSSRATLSALPLEALRPTHRRGRALRDHLWIRSHHIGGLGQPSVPSAASSDMARPGVQYTSGTIVVSTIMWEFWKDGVQRTHTDGTHAPTRVRSHTHSPR